MLKQPNSRTAEQFSFYLLILFVLATPFISFGQNIHDPYKDIFGLNTSTYQATGTQYPGGGYQGEYQFYLPQDHPWSNIPNAKFSVKTECVSFPFLPIHKYHTQTSNGQPNRVLGIPNSNTIERNSKEEYFIMQDYYNPKPKTATNQTFINSLSFNNSIGKIHTKFLGEAWYSVSWTNPIYTGLLSSGATSDTDNNTIISSYFHNINSNLSAIDNSSRNLFPHSILKHTLYVRTNCNQNEIIDSIIYIIDLTRGRMVNYPFTNTALNPTGAGETHYDIVVKFEAEAPTTYGSTGGSFVSEHSSNSYPIYNYFNSENTNWLFGRDGICDPNIYIPDTYPTSGDFQIFNTSLVKLPQYSKTGVLLLNHNLSNRAGYDNSSGTLGNINPLYKHTYKIDREFVINYINPAEKIVYNPSEVEIDLNNTNNTGSRTLTFPSGYTFKTVLGNYPKKTDVEAADPNNYYGKDPFKIPVVNTADTGPNSNGYQSKYIVKDGSTLVIEDCVTILDAEIVVEDGAFLEINRNKVFGNYTIVINTGGTEDPYQGPNQSNSCIQECLNTTIAGNDDWNNKSISTDRIVAANAPTIRVFGTLTIEAGKKLTLEEGVRLEFAPNSRVIVEDGARFITNGTPSNQVVLTSMCENMWDGIELRGKTSNTTAYAILDYTTLENAITGIKSFTSRNIDDYYGVVMLGNCTILNCITGVDIKTPNNSGCCNFGNRFSHCSFVTTDDIPDSRLTEMVYDKPTITHIKLNGIRNKSEFVSCTFENQNSWLKPHEQGIGIWVVDSWLLLGRHLATDVNTFTNLSVGVKMSDNLQYALTEIDDVVFTDNIYGIIALNRDYVHIHNNSFIIPENTTGTNSNTNGIDEANIDMYNRPTGIYVKTSSGFVINNNSFNGGSTVNTGTNCEFCSQAIIIDDTDKNFDSQGNGLVLDNDFNSIDLGLFTQGNNRGYLGQYQLPNYYIDGTGVSAACNNFNSLNLYDFVSAKLNYYPHLPNHPNEVPIRDQGYCQNDLNKPQNDHPALNTYNQCNLPQTRNVHNESASFDYYHAINNIPGCYASISMKPCDNFNTDDDDVSLKCHDYHSHFDPVSISLSGKRQQYIDKAEELEERISSFELLLDGGNTSNLLEVVENGALATAVAQLVSTGTYISDEVLLAAIERLGNEETQKLILILQANSKLSAAVWDAVVIHTNEYNSGLVEALVMYQEGVSARNSYIKWIDYTAYERNTIFDGLYFADMTSNDALTVTLDVLRGNSNPYIQKKLLPLLISEGEHNEAETLLNIIKETNNNSLYVLEQEAKLIMGRDAIGFNELEESLKDALALYWKDAPQQSSWSAMQAGFHSWNYYINPELIPTSTESNKWSGTQNNSSTEELINSNFLTCYPNPTNSGGTIKGYASILNHGNNQIRIYNSIGQLVSSTTLVKEQFQITVQLPAKGLYFIALYQNNTLLKHQKWVVQ